jgi:hypothetical protein
VNHHENHFNISSSLDRHRGPVPLVFAEGGHGVGNLIPQRVRNGFPPAKWPWRLVEWLDTVPATKGKATSQSGTGILPVLRN